MKSDKVSVVTRMLFLPVFEKGRLEEVTFSQQSSLNSRILTLSQGQGVAVQSYIETWIQNLTRKRVVSVSTTLPPFHTVKNDL